MVRSIFACKTVEKRNLRKEWSIYGKEYLL